MINASKEFKEKLKNGANVVNYADLTLSDGTVLHLEPKDFMIGGCTIEDKTTDGKFGVGFVIGKTLTLRIANHNEQFSQYDFYQSIINLYVAMLLDDGSIEKIRKGVYYATVPSTAGDIIEISAVDGMFKLDKDYANSHTLYPATLQTIISDACLDCGIPIGFSQFDNMSFTVKKKPQNVTYRQVVSYVAQISGYNARIDNNGYMQLVWYDTDILRLYYNGGDFKVYPHDTVIDGGNFTDYSTDLIISGGDFTDKMPEHIFRLKTLDIHTDDVQITGVRVIGEDDVTALFGEEGYLIEVSGNPFVYGQEKSVADYLGNRITGTIFRPFSAQILNNPLYEPYDVVRISDRKGNAHISIINSISYRIGGYTKISCDVEDPVRNSSFYSSPAAAAVVEARRNAEKQISTYDNAVQNMNQLSANALGYHTTYEDQPDGSRITYLHDKPTLEESMTIYKQTIDGFFISMDGGESYTAGFDKNGNAVVNILYVIGIVCDWIRGGTLTLGGADNVNGKLQVLDAKGNVICQITKDGLISQFGNLNDNIKGLGSRIDQTDSSITAEVKRAQGQETELAAAISVQADQIELKVSKGNVSSQLSVESGAVDIKSNRFSWESTHSSLTSDGKLSAKDVDLTGKIKSTSGEIGGFNIKNNAFYSGNKSSLTSTLAGVYIGNDGISCGSHFSVDDDGKANFSDIELSGNGSVAFSFGVNKMELNASGISFGSSTLTSEITKDKIKVYNSYIDKDGLHVRGTSSTYYTDIKQNKIIFGSGAAGGIYHGDTEVILLNTGNSLRIGDRYSIFGNNGGNIGFFGNPGAGKKTVSNITSVSSTTVISVAEKLNDLLTALRSYGLIG